MKAKVKATNTIHDVMSLDLVTSGLGEIVQTSTSFSPEDIEIMEQDTAPCDLWEERRFHVCKNMMASLISPVFDTEEEKWLSMPPSEAAKKAIRYADALINELKKQDNDKG